MSAAATWSAELESTGQVVFPQRRKRLWIRGAFVATLFATSLWSLVARIRADEMHGLFAVGRLTSLAGFAFMTGFTAWQLVTRRPMVVVDRTGVRTGSGDEHHATWHQIARIDAPSGGTLLHLGTRRVQLHPTDRHNSTALAITHDNVTDLAEFSTWLKALHTHQTSPNEA